MSGAPTNAHTIISVARIRRDQQQHRPRKILVPLHPKKENVSFFCVNAVHGEGRRHAAADPPPQHGGGSTANGAELENRYTTAGGGTAGTFVPAAAAERWISCKTFRCFDDMPGLTHRPCLALHPPGMQILDEIFSTCTWQQVSRSYRSRIRYSFIGLSMSNRNSSLVRFPALIRTHTSVWAHVCSGVPLDS